MELLKKDAVYHQLRNAIRSGKLKPLEKFPAEQQLAGELNVSLNTLRDSLNRLKQEGLIVKVNGKGTFVADKVQHGGGCYLAILNETSDIASPPQYILPGIEKHLRESGLRLETCFNFTFRHFTHEHAMRLFKEHSINGVFLLENNFTGKEPEIDLLRKSGLPVAIPGSKLQDEKIVDFAIMRPDSRQAFGDGIRYLARLGHRRIGTISNNTALYSLRGFSRDEYREFLSLNGLDASPCLIKETPHCPFTALREPVIRAVRELVLGPRPPTAIVCYSDFWAIYVYEALKQMHIRIPEQVAVMGYCGYPESKFMDPPLSTVDQEYENIGRMAVDLMLKSSEWFKPGVKGPVIITPHRLVERKSTNFLVKETAPAYREYPGSQNSGGSNGVRERGE